jgi:hypothetical protein
MTECVHAIEKTCGISVSQFSQFGLYWFGLLGFALAPGPEDRHHAGGKNVSMAENFRMSTQRVD